MASGLVEKVVSRARWCLCLVLAALPLMAQMPAPSRPTPALIGDGWNRMDPSAAGFDEASLLRTLAGMMDGKVNLHAVLVERHGKLVAEAYRRGRDRTVNSLFSHTRDFGPAMRHDARSMGKSVIGLLVGVAQAQGKLQGMETMVLDFYPEYPELATPSRQSITLGHLLSMSSGMA